MYDLEQIYLKGTIVKNCTFIPLQALTIHRQYIMYIEHSVFQLYILFSYCTDTLPPCLVDALDIGSLANSGDS